MTVTIRQGAVADAEALAQLAARTFAEAFAAENTEADLADYLASRFTVARFAQEL